jgi:hypothetical protein
MGGPRRRRSKAGQHKARSHTYSVAPHWMARIADTFVAWLHLASVLPKTAGMVGYSVDDGQWAPPSLCQRAKSSSVATQLGPHRSVQELIILLASESIRAIE